MTTLVSYGKTIAKEFEGVLFRDRGKHGNPCHGRSHVEEVWNSSRVSSLLACSRTGPHPFPKIVKSARKALLFHPETSIRNSYTGTSFTSSRPGLIIAETSFEGGPRPKLGNGFPSSKSEPMSSTFN